MSKSKWVLLVEDNENDAKLITMALNAQPKDYEIVRVCDWAQALEFLCCRGEYLGRLPENPTLMLLDLKMPRVDGLQVLEHTKGDPVLKTIPVVMLTSSREECDLRRSYELGANAFVVKPVSFEVFLKALTRIEHFWIEVNEPCPGHGQALEA